MDKDEGLFDAINTACAQWKAAFNSGYAIGCAKQYENTAIMYTRQMGTYIGKIEI